MQKMGTQVAEATEKTELPDPEQATDEPSMEEILNSIRQIISDQDEEPAAEEPPAEPAPEPAEDPTDIFDAVEPEAPEPEVLAETEETATDEADDDILELTDIVEDDDFDTVEFQEEEPEPVIEPEPEPIVEAAPEAIPEPKPEDTLPEINLDDFDTPEADPLPPLMDDVPLEKSADAMHSLHNFIKSQTRIYEDENTIEGIVRELLKPMLKQWLDENLPDVVEQLVKAEIARMTNKKNG